MRATTTTTIVVAVLLIATAGAHAQQCTPNHELYRIVPKYRAVMLDGGEIKRQMFVNEKDERLSTWKPGHNITYCPDQNKMIDTTINSIATLISDYGTACKPLLISDSIDRSLQTAWDDTNNQQAYPGSVFYPDMPLAEAERQLGWYYEVCTDHEGISMFEEKEDLKRFLITAESLTRINMAIDDPVNERTYKERAAKYKKWDDALWAAESKKSWAERVWERVTH